jgi:hypothetical protein
VDVDIVVILLPPCEGIGITAYNSLSRNRQTVGVAVEEALQVENQPGCTVEKALSRN